MEQKEDQERESEKASDESRDKAAKDKATAKDMRNKAMERLSHMKVRDFEAMKGIDYVTETNTYHAFYLSTHPSEKLVFALSGTRTHVSLITSRAC